MSIFFHKDFKREFRDSFPDFGFVRQIVRNTTSKKKAKWWHLYAALFDLKQISEDTNMSEFSESISTMGIPVALSSKSDKCFKKNNIHSTLKYASQEGWISDYIGRGEATIFNKNIIEDIKAEIRKKCPSTEKYEKKKKASIKGDLVTDNKNILKSKRYLTEISTVKFMRKNVYFVGRESELDRLRRYISEGKHIISISGMGGIGKTSLLSKLFYEIKNRYDEIVCITYRNNLPNSITPINVYNRDGRLVELDEDPVKRWQEICGCLSDDGKKKLFIIDNADIDEREKQNPHEDVYLLKEDKKNGKYCLKNWGDTTIIFTTRENIRPDDDEIARVEVEAMSNDNLLNLFFCYYSGKMPEDVTSDWLNKFPPEMINTVKGLIRLSGNNTLAVELMARGAKNVYETPSELEAYLQKLASSLSDSDVVVTKDGNTESLIHFLKKVLDLQARKQEEQSILNAFACFPMVQISKEEASAWFFFPPNELLSLRSSGWLQFDGVSGTYSIHPVVKEVILSGFDNHTAPNGTLNDFVTYISTRSEDFLDIDDSYSSIEKKVNVIDSVSKYLESCSWNNAPLFCCHLGNAYLLLWRLSDAEKILRDAITKSTASSLELVRATAENYLSVVYDYMGRFSDAKCLIESAIETRERILGNVRSKSDAELADYYCNYASILYHLEYLMEAKAQLEKAIKIEENTLGKEHRHLATTYSSYATICSEISHEKEVNNCLHYINESIRIRENLPPIGYHPDLASSYFNRAMLYHEHFGKQKFIDSRDDCQKAIKIVEGCLPKNHITIARYYNGMAKILCNSETPKDLEDSEKNIEDAISILKDKPYEGKQYLAESYYTRAEIYSSNYFIKKDLKHSIEFSEKAHSILKQILPNNSRRYAYSFLYLARRYRDVGDREKYFDNKNSAISILKDNKISEERIVEILDKWDYKIKKHNGETYNPLCFLKENY